MKEIVLASGHRSMVSDEDYDYLSRWKWKRHPQGYAARTGYVDRKFVTLLMHRVITGAARGEEVHHLNGNKLDNRRENLQLIGRSDHKRHHAPALVAFQKSRQVYPDRKPCIECGKEFAVNPRKRKRNVCCSTECSTARRVRAANAARAARAALREPNRCESCGVPISSGKATRCIECFRAGRKPDGTFG